MKKILLLALAALVALASCSSDPKPGSGDGVFQVDNAPLSVTWQQNDDAVISVTANVAWTAQITSGTGAALAAGSQSGSGDGTVTVEFSENDSEGSRQITVKISTTAKVATKSYNVTITQNGKPNQANAAYVRVDESLEDWSGDYLIVFEGQGTPTATTYKGTSILAFNGSLTPTTTPVLDGIGNVMVLAAAPASGRADIEALTGGVLTTALDEDEKITDITVTGGQIAANAANDAVRVIIAPVDGGYSIQTASGYYIGGGTGGNGGALSASKTLDAAKHTHTIAIGSVGSNAEAGVTYHNSAIIASTHTTNPILRINAGTGRFGYWGIITGSGQPGQHPVALYRRNMEVPEALVFLVNTDPISVGWEANDEAVIPVTANVEWSAAITSGTGAELDIYTDENGNPIEVAVLFDENESENSHQITVTVSTEADVAVKSYDVVITQAGKPGSPAYVRVNSTPSDWSGDYLLVYEGQTMGTGTYKGSAILAFNSALTPSSTPVLDGAGNIIVLAAAPETGFADLGTLTGGVVDRSVDNVVSITGGRIEATQANDAYRVIIAPVTGGYSIKTVSDYYIGGSNSAGGLAANKTFSAAAHTHSIAIGSTTSAVTGNTGISFRNCAIITAGAGSSNTLRVNAGTGRFGYWAEGNQYPVALYKRNSDALPSGPAFSVNTTPMYVGAEAGNTTIAVTGNVAWAAAITSGTGASIQAGSGSGTGGGTVTVVFAQNTTGGPRDVKVTVSTTEDVTTKSYEVTITQVAPGADVPSLHPRYVRIVALGDPGPTNDWRGTWMLSTSRRPEFVRDYYAEDVLEWIADLKPYCLERFISGYQGSTRIPKRGGGNMPVIEFLNKAILAGGEGCHICPKLDLTWLRASPGTNNYKNFWEGAQKLYDMPLVTPIRSVSLDCWNNYKEYLTEQGLSKAQQAAAMQDVFDRLRAIGYQEIGVNLTGANNWGPAENVLDFVDFNINTTSWKPSLGTSITDNPAIKKNSEANHATYLLYIDYPGPYEKFVEANTPDQMADVYTKNIWPQQAKQGFVFVYSLSNAGWDPFAHVTDPNGPYQGKNMYDITKECLFRTK